MKSITCTFAVPPRILSPNIQAHWAAKERAKVKIRESAAIETHNAGGTGWGVGATWIYLDAKWFGKTRIALKIDQDNAWATLKTTLDAAARQMECNDKVFAPRSMEFDHDPKNPRVEITFTVEDGNG